MEREYRAITNEQYFQSIELQSLIKLRETVASPTGVTVPIGILHLSGSEQWPYVVWATAVGLLLGYSALLTGNLLVPIVATSSPI